jgi:hypothetical protein
MVSNKIASKFDFEGAVCQHHRNFTASRPISFRTGAAFFFLFFLSFLIEICGIVIGGVIATHGMELSTEYLACP